MAIKTIRLYPTDDTYIKNGTAGISGAANTMRFGRDAGGSTYFAYIKFDLAQVPINANIISAKMNLKVASTTFTKDTIITVQKTTNEWSEDTLATGNKPSTTSSGIPNVTVAYQATNVEVNLKSYFEGLKTLYEANTDIGHTYGFVFTKDSTMNETLDFYTKESVGNEPFLEVVYEVVETYIADANFTGWELLDTAGRWSAAGDTVALRVTATDLASDVQFLTRAGGAYKTWAVSKANLQDFYYKVRYTAFAAGKIGGNTVVSVDLAEGMDWNISQYISTNFGWELWRTPKNAVPTITDVTNDNQTLYENDTITINGAAIDADAGNIVNVRYQVDSSAIKAIATAISDGVSPVPYSKTLTFSNGKLKDGMADVTAVLDGSLPHTIKIWAEDDKGGKSTVISRTFNVVPNRSPGLTIDAFVDKTNLINNDEITLTGNSTDPDNNDVTVTAKVNNDPEVQVYGGAPGPWTHKIKLGQLKEGANTVTLKAVDSYNFVFTKQITINKTPSMVPVPKAVVRYKITPPAGTVDGIIAWVQKEIGDLELTGEVAFINEGENETFTAMEKYTAPIDDVVNEDEFNAQAAEAKGKLILKLTMERVNPAATEAIKLITGALN